MNLGSRSRTGALGRLRAFGGGTRLGLGPGLGVGCVPACHRRRRTTHESQKLYQTPTMHAFAELTLSEVQLCYTPGRRGAVGARSPEPVGSPTQNRMRATLQESALPVLVLVTQAPATEASLTKGLALQSPTRSLPLAIPYEIQRKPLGIPSSPRGDTPLLRDI